MTMSSPQFFLLAGTVAGCFAFNGIATAQTNATPSAATSMQLTPPTIQAMQALDTDKDGTISLTEAIKGAARHFAAFDVDHDGTLDRKEAAAAGLSTSDFRKADTDKDGTLDRREYAAFVRARFKATDTDSDGTVSTRELGTSQGNALLTLVR